MMVGLQVGWWKNSIVALGLGQLVSLLQTSTGFSSSLLSRNGIDAPTSQSFSIYVLLAIVYGSIVIHRRRALQIKWYYYFVLAIFDVEANFLVVKAYQYTSLTSVMLLDCWTIPSVIFLTWMFLKAQYRFRKFAGVAICVAGLVTVIFSDVHASDRGGGSNPIKGDMLVIVGSMLYAISNVSEEFLVKSGDTIELMAMLGAFGAVVSACQIWFKWIQVPYMSFLAIATVFFMRNVFLLGTNVSGLRSILERDELQSIHWRTSTVFPFIGYAVAMFSFYSLVPVLLKMSGSTMLNLSLLTSDMWAVFVRFFAYHEKVDWLYYVAFGAVAVGLVIYSGGDKEEDGTRAEIAESRILHQSERDEEARGDCHFKAASVGCQNKGHEGKGPYYVLINDEQ